MLSLYVLKYKDPDASGQRSECFGSVCAHGRGCRGSGTAVAPDAAWRSDTGVGQQPHDPRGEAARRHTDAKDPPPHAVGIRADPDRGARPQGQCICDRSQASALDLRLAERRRADRRVIERAAPSNAERLRLRDGRHDAPRPAPWGSAPIASRCCATPTGMA
jgi:hypothetical protein